MNASSSADRFERLNAIVDVALEMPVEAQAAYLDEACGTDAALRREAGTLLEAHSLSEGFLDVPVLQLLAEDAGPPPVTDLTGQRIDRYEVISRLGAGGVGEVWLAEDTSLKRKAALKLLSAKGAADPRQVRRFQQEARAASLLNHPNIITIYEIGKWGEIDFIAEEFVLGETLRQRVRNGPLNAAPALQAGIQVAGALAAAHAAGIIHRDIKPENIMVRADGVVKVLDFGLARFVERNSSKDDDSLSIPGVVRGTVRYMSPEQARGLPLDPRTDIFSLGAVLYEVLAGTPAFSGPTWTDILAAILHKDPPPLSGRSLAVPPEFERIVRRCLEKDTTARYASAAELRRDLRGMASQLGVSDVPSDEMPIPAGQVSPGTQAEKLRRKHWTLSISIILAGVVALIGAILFVSRSRPPEPAFNTMTITRLATRGESTGAAISPDGKYLAYVLRDEGGESIWTRQLATGSDVRVIRAEAGEHVGMKFSPDGAYLYYRLNNTSGAHDLYRVPALGGTPARVMEGVPGSIAFAPDGKWLALVRIDPARVEASLTIANLDGSDVRTIRTRRHPEYYSRDGIAWSPDSTSIACFAGNATGFSSQAFRLVSVRVADGIETPISSETWAWVDSVVWSADGGFIAVDGSKVRQDTFQIWLLSFPEGRTTRLTNDLSNYRRMTLSGDGKTLTVLQTRRQIDLWIAPAGSPERAARVASENVQGMNGLAWTPDGRVIFLALDGGQRNVWSVDPTGSDQREISSGPLDKQELAVTRDGRYVLYSSRGTIWRTGSDGSNPTQLTNGSWDVHPTSSADSRFVLYASFRNWSPAIWGKPTIWRVPIDGGQPVQVGEEAASLPQVSPDGNKVAGNYYPGPNPEYSASPLAVFNASGRLLQVFQNISLGGSPVSWTPEGKALIYIARAHGVGNLWRQPLAGGPPVQLTYFRTEDLFSFAFSREFEQVALARGKETSDIVLLSHFR